MTPGWSFLPPLLAELGNAKKTANAACSSGLLLLHRHPPPINTRSKFPLSCLHHPILEDSFGKNHLFSSPYLQQNAPNTYKPEPALLYCDP